MDLVLNVLDANLLTPYVYPETWPEDDIIRQFISLLAVVNMGGYVLYLSIATLNFYFIFDHVLMKHPLFLKVICMVIFVVVALKQFKHGSVYFPTFQHGPFGASSPHIG